MTPAGDGPLAAWADVLARMPDPTAGDQVEEFEAELAHRFGAGHAVATSSGTTALHLAMAGLGIGPGDEVLVPAVSVVMSAAPVIHTGARPVFVDCAPDGAGFDLTDLAAKSGSATAAILPVHLWGRCGDPAGLTALADQIGVPVIEDACQAQGTRSGDRHAGTTATGGCFSLKDGKILWSGEGGYLLTDDPVLAADCRALRSHWQAPPPGQAPLSRVGYNYRLAEPLAALARANLARFDDLLARRQLQAHLLMDGFADAPGMHPIPPTPGQTWNGYCGLARLTLDRPREFCRHLADLGVPNSVGTFHLVPTDRRPPFTDADTTPCPRAAGIIDTTLAVVLTDHDNDDRIAGYAQTIIREAHRWPRR
ncbi:MAG: aminotransferase class I/II-fold pyridoxal phosphate-dependent enzyme [Actinobacteria bacterium]|nr:aminotransferase class I/II-fold pyridoxal phosphate-dependent enzyme [Actinomycetota bacterium]MBI3686015.1 aminotransferase class I/II-fold pyridoxal phosphate-dependent enzyme [Actinomycetota bacterium]